MAFAESQWRPWPFSSILASRRRIYLLVAISVSLALLWSLRNRHNVQPFGVRKGGPSCDQLPGGDNVLVIMRTGAHEVQDKLAVHLRTTLTCYPSHIIISDFEEDLPTGEHLYDAFKYTTQSLKDTHSDFAPWRKLQAEGRAGVSSSDQSGTNSRPKLEAVRKKIPGWQLDKWKFLPMVNRTLELHPDKHWYVFVEADTYLMWSNLLPYLAQRSWSEDLYVGSRAVIEELGFAHGGTGFLLSRSALEKVVALFQKEQRQWEDYTDRYWVGDHILASALREAGVTLENGVPPWPSDPDPSWQGESLSLLDISPEHGLWCDPAITFHHVNPSEVEDLWNFEQNVRTSAQSVKTGPHGMLRHRDLLEEYVLPRIQKPLSSWDNKADGSRHSDIGSLSECEAVCERDTGCMLYTLHNDGSCFLTSKVVLGEASEGVQSGWLPQRIQEMLDESTQC